MLVRAPVAGSRDCADLAVVGTRRRGDIVGGLRPELAHRAIGALRRKRVVEGGRALEGHAVVGVATCIDVAAAEVGADVAVDRWVLDLVPAICKTYGRSKPKLTWRLGRDGKAIGAFEGRRYSHAVMSLSVGLVPRHGPLKPAEVTSMKPLITRGTGGGSLE